MTHMDSKPEIVASKIGQETKNRPAAVRPRVPPLDVRNVSREVYSEQMSSRVAKQLLTFKEETPSVCSSTSSSTPCVSARVDGRDSLYRGGRRHLTDPGTQRRVTSSRRRFVSADSARQEMLRSMPRCEHVPKVASIADIGWSPTGRSMSARGRHEDSAVVRPDQDTLIPLKVRGESPVRYAARTFKSSLEKWTGSAAATQSDTPRSVRGSSVVRSFRDRDRISRIPIGARGGNSEIGSPRSTASTPRTYRSRALGSSHELLEALGNDRSAMQTSVETSRARTRACSASMRDFTPTNLRCHHSPLCRRDSIIAGRPPPKAWNAGLGRKLFS
ncbi:hypothetical protein FOZ63_003218 [Perkinsus olseni]|uniref:Uncharacterized protein n=1 Tax=Perkinsus olseni TaxID=32597 RepID=A0A7J6RIG7_PEROL|nr:hypothetical protein FOZ63_003218 [Perkinsus olseni]KAF4737061.1 hypothetical protein FOZ62_006635 [Perkinsus olseni]